MVLATTVKDVMAPHMKCLEPPLWSAWALPLPKHSAALKSSKKEKGTNMIRKSTVALAVVCALLFGIDRARQNSPSR